MWYYVVLDFNIKILFEIIEMIMLKRSATVIITIQVLCDENERSKERQLEING
jgi:hypothetical protein